MQLVPLISLFVAGVAAASCGAPTPSPEMDAGVPHIPCEVDALLTARCRVCHSNPPTQYAPFPLVTQADFQRPFGGSTVAERAVGAVESDFMPLNATPLNSAEKTLLIGWLDAGVPLSTANCN
ncbi:MAG: hypothetical protein Q8N23_36905 [Archangium sp.]|nr:hypothetical protein [Archangium sp.]MDP3569597.1 hypothetical protein [Archangium sp.]